ncbi:response regulator [Candidatus Nitrosotalea sp. TS]|uniref:response regulator n=1 Tax=Candidatus Nitrosotalea sp. TS TaxID=2341020 RepID=UPI0014089823
MRILGVDDNTDITKLLNTILSSEGHEFSSVDNGREGLKRMREQSYDLIFLDLSMPGFSGLDVVRRACQGRQHQQTKNCPVYSIFSI